MHGGAAGQQVLDQPAQGSGALLVEASHGQRAGFLGVDAGRNVDAQRYQSFAKLGFAYLFVMEHGPSPLRRN
ncbi:hypothetical protein D3C77_643760 [compost metagenome]